MVARPGSVAHQNEDFDHAVQKRWCSGRNTLIDRPTFASVQAPAMLGQRVGGECKGLLLALFEFLIKAGKEVRS